MNDELGAYLETIPRGLNGDRWARWRARHRPPYFQRENRRDGKCGLCGGQLSAWLNLCQACMTREFEYVRQLPSSPRKQRVVPRTEDRTLREEWRDYPEQGRWRRAERKQWWVVEDPDGLEVTRALEPGVAEGYL